MIEKLQQYMKRYNLNQRQLASLLGVSESHLSCVLAGGKKPGAKLVESYFQLPGIQESERIRSVKDYICAEFTKGNMDRGQFKEIVTKINPED